jgi:hypothetical protein
MKKLVGFLFFGSLFFACNNKQKSQVEQDYEKTKDKTEAAIDNVEAKAEDTWNKTIDVTGDVWDSTKQGVKRGTEAMKQEVNKAATEIEKKTK